MFINNGEHTRHALELHDHASGAAGGSVWKPLKFVDKEHSQAQEDHGEEHEHGRAAVSGAGVHQRSCGGSHKNRNG